MVQDFRTAGISRSPNSFDESWKSYAHQEWVATGKWFKNGQRVGNPGRKSGILRWHNSLIFPKHWKGKEYEVSNVNSIVIYVMWWMWFHRVDDQNTGYSLKPTFQSVLQDAAEMQNTTWKCGLSFYLKFYCNCLHV